MNEGSNVFYLLVEVGMLDVESLVTSGAKKGASGDILGDTGFLKGRNQSRGQNIIPLGFRDVSYRHCIFKLWQ